MITRYIPCVSRPTVVTTRLRPPSQLYTLIKPVTLTPTMSQRSYCPIPLDRRLYGASISASSALILDEFDSATLVHPQYVPLLEIRPQPLMTFGYSIVLLHFQPLQTWKPYSAYKRQSKTSKLADVKPRFSRCLFVFGTRVLCLAAKAVSVS